MLVIGVTGGIASGKSTLAKMIAGRGIAHVDADRLVHQLLAHDRETIAAVTAAFPNVSRETLIDRRALAQHITKHPEALTILERILHPRVRALEIAAIAHARRNGLRAVALDIPLLYETAADELCDIVITAYAPLSTRRRRALTRPGMTQEKFVRLVARQWGDGDRNVFADIVIPTTLGKATTRRKLQRLMVEWGLL